jgi:glycosyltransferase involved in cell wall biosynthesis
VKILFDHSSPFLLAHGGVQVQIEQTKAALARAGIEVDFLRWWNDAQLADVIHYFGSIPHQYLDLARQKRIPVVLTAYFSSTCNRSDLRLSIQGSIIRSLSALPGWGSIKAQLQWRTFREADHVIVGLEAERGVLRVVYGVPEARISVVQLGLNDVYLKRTASAKRESGHLITVGTIREVKRSAELAMMARQAEVPILFVGDPYSERDPYWNQFQSLIDSRFVLHRPHVRDVVAMSDLMSTARGFVLFSEYENWSLAAHEAAACGLPLLLPDRKWSRERFGGQARYFSQNDRRANVTELKNFHAEAGRLAAPQIEHYSWNDVAGRLMRIYRNVLEQCR